MNSKVSGGKTINIIYFEFEEEFSAILIKWQIYVAGR